MEKKERGRIQGLHKFFGYPILSQERVKLRTSNFVGTFIGSIGTKAHENVGNSSRGRSQGVPKFFRAPMHIGRLRGHLATAQLSCNLSNEATIKLYSILSSMHQNVLAAKLRSDPLRSLHRSPGPLHVAVWIKGPGGGPPGGRTGDGMGKEGRMWMTGKGRK